MEDLNAAYMKNCQYLEKESKQLEQEINILSKKVINLYKESSLLTSEFKILYNKFDIINQKKNVLDEEYNNLSDTYGNINDRIMIPDNEQKELQEKDFSSNIIIEDYDNSDNIVSLEEYKQMFTLDKDDNLQNIATIMYPIIDIYNDGKCKIDSLMNTYISKSQ